jgi:hypothetical protein
MMEAAEATPFKRCTICSDTWDTRADFLGDPRISMIGYQAFLDAPSQGMYLFNHEPCGTTLAVKVSSFEDLYSGPVYSQRLTDLETCRCPRVDDLNPCDRKCSCAWVRQLMQKIRGWEKRQDGGCPPGT